MGQGAADAATQAGNTLGTDRGLSVDPAEVAAAALQGGAARLGSEVPGAVAGGIKAGSDAVMARLQPDLSADQGASTKRVFQMYQDAKSGSQEFGGPGAGVSDTTAMNNVKSTLAFTLDNYARTLRSQGALSSDDYGLVSTALDQALRHNNTLSDSDGGVFDRVQSLPLDPQYREGLVQGLRDLNTVSSQSFLKNQQGPFQQVGRVVGKFGGFAYGALHGNIPEMVGAAILGHEGISGRIGGAVGSGLDSVFGTATPTLILQQVKANQALKAAGITDAGPHTMDLLNSLTELLQDPSESLRTQLGMPATVDPAAALAAKAQARLEERGRTLQERAADQVAGMAYRQPAAIANRDNGIYGQMAIKSRADQFEQSGGAIGNPAAPSDPLLVRASGAPVPPPPAQSPAAPSPGPALGPRPAPITPDANPVTSSNAAVANAYATAAQRLQGTLASAGSRFDQITAGGSALDPAVAQAAVRANAIRAMQNATTSGPGDASASPLGGLLGRPMTGWKFHVADTLAQRGVPNVTPLDISKAVDQTVSAGLLSPEIGQALKTTAAPIHHPILDRIAAQVASNKGMAHILDTEAVGPTSLHPAPADATEDPPTIVPAIGPGRTGSCPTTPPCAARWPTWRLLRATTGRPLRRPNVPKRPGCLTCPAISRTWRSRRASPVSGRRGTRSWAPSHPAAETLCALHSRGASTRTARRAPERDPRDRETTQRPHHAHQAPTGPPVAGRGVRRRQHVQHRNRQSYDTRRDLYGPTRAQARSEVAAETPSEARRPALEGR